MTTFQHRHSCRAAIRFVALLLLGIAAGSVHGQSYPADVPPEPLKIATWNLEWFFDAYQGNNQSDIAREEAPANEALWKWKRDAIAASIAEMQPTVIALQEIEGKGVLHELTKQLKDAHRLSYRIAFVEGFDSATEQDVGILFQSGCVGYSRREQNNQMFTSQNFYNLSKHLFADFEWDAGGRTESLTLLTVHLRARAEAAKERIKQSRLVHYMVKAAVERGDNVIVLGDMNFESQQGIAMADDDGIEAMVGRGTPSTNDDLIDLHAHLPADRQRTHLVLDKQFDRILVSRSMIEDDPTIRDWVLEKVEVMPQLVIRGNDSVEDHWDKRYSKPEGERELSDHFPMMATFRLK